MLLSPSLGKENLTSKVGEIFEDCPIWDAHLEPPSGKKPSIKPDYHSESIYDSVT